MSVELKTSIPANWNILNNWSANQHKCLGKLVSLKLEQSTKLHNLNILCYPKKALNTIGYITAQRHIWYDIFFRQRMARFREAKCRPMACQPGYQCIAVWRRAPGYHSCCWIDSIYNMLLHSFRRDSRPSEPNSLVRSIGKARVRSLWTAVGID